MGISGNTIKEIREEKGWSQEYLAQLTGYDRSTVTKIEKSEELNRTQEKKFKKAFGEKYSHFFTGSQTPSGFKVVEEDLVLGGREYEIPFIPEKLLAFYPIIKDLEEGEYKLFPVDGNSMMHTVYPGDYLYCKKESVSNIINGRVYVLIITDQKMKEYRRSGRWVKRCYSREKGFISCKSDNADSTEPYFTFRKSIKEIAECWYPVLKISGYLLDPNKDIYNRLDEIEDKLEMLQSLNE